MSNLSRFRANWRCFFRSTERGDTLVEVSIGLAILAMVLAGTISLASYAFRVNNTARERTQAINYAQEQAEGLRNFRDSQTSWGSFTGNVGGAAFAGGGKLHMDSSGGWHPLAGRVNSPTVPALYRDTSSSSRGIYISVTSFTSNSLTFAITVKWAQAGGGADNQTTIYTRLVNTNP